MFNPNIEPFKASWLNVVMSVTVRVIVNVTVLFVVSDLSFISLTKVLPNLKTLLNPNGHEMICLIKPQFEAGKELVEKGGVVKDKKTHELVINNVLACIKDLGYIIKGLTYSSIKGPAGNIEYLVWLATEGEEVDIDVKNVINSAHENL